MLKLIVLFSLLILAAGLKVSMSRVTVFAPRWTTNAIGRAHSLYRYAPAQFESRRGWTVDRKPMLDLLGRC